MEVHLLQWKKKFIEVYPSLDPLHSRLNQLDA